MGCVTQAYVNLMAKPLDDTRRPIRSLVALPDEGHPSYGDEIVDYSQVPSPYTHKLVSAKGLLHNTAHGPHPYADLVKLVMLAPVHTLLDLGCGGCDFLNELVQAGIPPDGLYGCTIHIGECKLAHARGYTNVAPIDMREIDVYYQPASFDCITTNWAFQHITLNDRMEVMEKALALLVDGGRFIGRDYYGLPETAIPIPSWANVLLHTSTDYGNIIVLARP